MDFKRFSMVIFTRIILLIISVYLAGTLITLPGYHVSTLLILILVAYQSYSLINYVEKTNREVSRFFDAVKNQDFSQRFNLNELGNGFGELGEDFAYIISGLHKNKSDEEKQTRILQSVIEQVPVPLLSQSANGKITLWNNKVRGFFGTHPVATIEDLDSFGSENTALLQKMKPGEQRLLKFDIDDIDHHMMVSSSQIVVDGEVERLYSLLDIRNELDGAQLHAWQDLVRVLTHEIMNSITPISSLSNTAKAVAKEISITEENEETLQDLVDAVDTISRRSENLMHFVESYRKLTRLPSPVISTIELSELFLQISTLAKSDYNIDIECTVSPPSLSLSADRSMTEQILINLVKNAQQALQNDNQSNTKKPKIWLGAMLDKKGRVIITVEDNGPGVPENIKDSIFVPFYTTKRDGSGVGLALARQIMLAHKGNIKLRKGVEGGALFKLIY